MCDFITATLDGKADIAAIRPVFERHGFHLDPETFRASPQGEVFFRPTRGHCDCGTVLGRSKRGTSPEEHAERRAAEVAKLEKQGWSRAKINRWCKQRDEEGGKMARVETETARWLTLVADVLQLPRVSHLGLMVHAYRAAADPIELLERKARRVPIGELSAAVLHLMEDGILYQFVRAEPRFTGVGGDRLHP
jgi:hypothetical protein